MCTGTYFTGAQPLRGSRAAAFGSGSGPIFLSQLDCLGDEASLLDCPTFSPPGLHDCDHTQDAGVRCIGRHCTMHSLSFVWIVLQSHFFFHHYTIFSVVDSSTYVHILCGIFSDYSVKLLYLKYNIIAKTLIKDWADVHYIVVSIVVALTRRAKAPPL